MSNLSAGQLFRLQFGSGSCSRNFVTPKRLRLLKLSRRVAVELSTGYIMGDTLYGVTTVCMRPNGETRKGKCSSLCFEARYLADRHIQRMAAILNGGSHE